MNLTTLKYVFLAVFLAIITNGWTQCGEYAGPDESICFSELPLNFATPQNTTWSGDGITPFGEFSPATGGVYTLTLHTDDGVCIDSDSKVITVKNNPIVNAGSDEMVCEFTSFQLEATASSTNGNIVVWSWSGDDQYLSSTNIPNPVASPVGSSSFNLTVADEGGCFSFDQVNLTTAPLPSVNAGTDLEICHTNNPISLVGSPAGGVWSGPGVNGNEFISPGVGTHNLEYEYTDAMGCTNTDQRSITVNPIPSINAGSNLELCENDDTIILDDFSPSSATWSGSGVVGDNFSPNGLSGSVILTLTHGSGTCMVSDERIIQVNDVPVVTAPSSSGFCRNESDNELIGFLPSGGFWTGSVIASSSSGTVNTETVVTDANITYNYSSDVTGCTAEVASLVSVYELPEPSFSLASEGCINEPFEITNTSSSSGNFIWFVDGQEESQSFSPSLSSSSAGEFEIYLNITTSDGCSVSSETQTTLIKSPPVALFSTDTDSGCEPLDVTFSNESSGEDLSYIWDFEVANSVNSDPGTLNFGNVTEDTFFNISLEATNICGSSTHNHEIFSKAIPTADFHTEISTVCSPVFTDYVNTSIGQVNSFIWSLGDGEMSDQETPEQKVYTTTESSEIFEITLEATNECGSDVYSELLEVSPNPVSASFIPSVIETCAPASIDFTDSGIGATDIRYEMNGEIYNNSNVSLDFLEVGSFMVTQYATDGCGFDTTSVEIVIFPEPILEIEASQLAFCSGQEVDFSLSGDPVENVIWQVGDLGQDASLSPSVVFQSLGSQIITADAFTIDHGCAVSTSTEIEVFDLPQIDFTLSSNEECSPYRLDISNNSDYTDFITWTLNGIESNEYSPSFYLTENGFYDLTVSASNINGCESDESVNQIFSLQPTPIADFSFTPDEGHIISTPEISFQNFSSGADVYLWNFGDGESSFGLNQVHEYSEAGVFYVELTASTLFGCSHTFRNTVLIKDEFSAYIPNSFSPNGDAINEVFKPVIEGSNFSNYSFKVFNRWGHVMFETNNPDTGWTGNVNDGSHYVANGVYTWELSALLRDGDGTFLRSGVVNVFR